VKVWLYGAGHSPECREILWRRSRAMGRSGLLVGYCRRRTGRVRRPVRLRQVHDAAHARRSRRRHVRQDSDRRAGRHRACRRKIATSRWCSRTTRSIHRRPSTTTWPSAFGSGATSTAGDRSSGAQRGVESRIWRPLLERKPRQLSGGQMQRVALGRALVQRPRRIPPRRAPLQPRRQAARPDPREEIATLHARLGARR
jgi:hypothetical protein